MKESFEGNEDCLKAVFESDPAFRPDWTGDELLAFYENRILTPEQCRAIIWYETVKSMQGFQPHMLDMIHEEDAVIGNHPKALGKSSS
jgi:hypothetical protein